MTHHLGIKTRQQVNFCGAEPIIESEECGSGGAYLPWSPWSVCNQECAGGVSSRSRSHSCGLAAEQDSRACGRTGYYGSWTPWSNCLGMNGDVVLCGGGARRRSREGFCGSMDEIQEVECNMHTAF